MCPWKIIEHQYWRDEERRQMEETVQPMKRLLFSEWLRQSIRYFREMDFFKPWSELSDEALAQIVIDSGKEKSHSRTILEAFQDFQSSGMPFGLCPPDSYIIEIDKTRVWYRSIGTEMDYVGGPQSLVDIINEWAAISRGVFNPQDIAVSGTFRGETPIEIALILDGTRYQFPMRYYYGELDLDDLQQGVNNLISHTGYSFERADWLLVLTQEEKEKLKAERNWWWYETLEGYF